jgi:hypothetical protein
VQAVSVVFVNYEYWITLSSSSIMQLRSSEFEKSLTTLELFAHGTYETYIGKS